MATGMVFGFSNLGVDVIIINLFALIVHVDQAAADMKPSNHLFNIIVNNKRMGFARRLVDEAALSSNPIVLYVPPRPFADISVNRRGIQMPVTAYRSVLPSED